MKFVYQEDRIQVIEGETNATDIINDITAFGTTNQDEPFYVFDIGDVVKKHQIWIEQMPRVIPHYAVKCNDNEVVLATLAALGTSFDCASKGEINKILSMGVNPEKIIFANPTKPKSHIRHAVAVGVKTMTFDCEIELQKIKAICPDANLVLRVRCEAEEAQCPLGKKFGCDPITEAPKLLKIACGMNMNIMGISFHVGSGCRDYPIYYKAIGICRKLFDEAEELGFTMTMLDIGGGFPGDNDKNINEVALIVNQGLEVYFPDKNVRVIAEPGRFYVASAFTLVTNIHSKKNIYDAISDERNHVMYYINDGVYGSFNSLLYDHQLVKPLLLQPLGEDEKKMASTIWGPTCDALDQIITDIQLPDINIGDFIIFENMGAYTIPVASPFNGFPLPKIFCFIPRDVWQMIRSLVPLDADDFIEDFLNKTIEQAIVSA